MKTRNLSQIALLPLVAMMILLLAGCGRGKQIIEVDPRFSMNVVKTPYWFPGKQELTPVELDVLDRYGSPNFIRFWWREDGSMINSSDLSGRDQEVIQADLNNMTKSWIYLSNNIEVVFAANRMSHREQPVSEVTRTLCLYGDPGMRQVNQFTGREVETWIWMDHGRMATVEDGRITKMTRIGQGTGSGTYLLK